MGRSRETTSEQANFLMEVALRFQEVLNQALTTSYATNDLFEKYPELKLATRFVTRNEQSSEDMKRVGHKFTFIKRSSSFEGDDEDDTEDGYMTLAEAEAAVKNSTLATRSQVDTKPAARPATGLQVRKEPTPADLEEHLLEPMLVAEPIRENILDWIKQIHAETRGLELGGTFQQSILPNSFKMQTAKWDDIAKGYIADTITIAHSLSLIHI